MMCENTSAQLQGTLSEARLASEMIIMDLIKEQLQIEQMGGA